MNYKSTLNLPKTKFSMKANLKELEIKCLKNWYKDDLYNIIRKSKKNKIKFLIHDGPPYANGNIHIGHALNKILKDIILKSKSLSGFNTPYIPGWDCHGLPIEHKIEQDINLSNKNFSSNKFRKICRNYAFQQVKMQKKTFIRLGILGDWNNFYLTMNFKTEANIVRSFSKIIQKGYLYQGIKPVYWCFNCQSALAEAEVEYFEKKSHSAYVSFQLINDLKINDIFQNQENKKIFLLVWTTMPWTLPGNCAIAVNENYDYQLIKTDNNIFLVVAKKILSNLMKEIKIKNWEILKTFKGKILNNFYVKHPFLKINVPVITSNHVKVNAGTGIVHIAPGHGIDDYYLAKKFNLKIINLISSNGLFKNDEFPEINGLKIFQADNFIIDILKKKKLIFLNHIIHSYPYCWRHKKPVFFRTTPQWFINIETNNLRNKLLKIIDNIKWHPKWGKERIKSMIINRPDWCVSRQRLWGVPIPLFVNKKTGKLHPNTVNIIEKTAEQIEKNGIESWWNLKKDFFLKKDETSEYRKVLDTLDVWFDSGSIHDSVMRHYPDFLNHPANLYIEGSDQYRGWFMSSLIISTIINNKPSYSKVLTHGFTVDENGKKMSKSRLNNINAQSIINKFGADVFRIWVASTDYKNDMIVSEKNFFYASNIYRRIRNTARFLLANLNKFNPDIHIIKLDKMVLIDKWAIDKTKKTQDKIIKAYDSYNFHDVIKILMHFCSIDMGSCYLDIIKDRKYTTKLGSDIHSSCQTALFYILESLVRWISPIIPFTADEIWRFLPQKNKPKYIFTEEWYDKLSYLTNNEFIDDDLWKFMFCLRNEVNIIIEQYREKKIVGNSLESEITFYVHDDILFNKLKIIEKELKFFLLVSKVTLLKNNLLDKNINDTNNIILKKIKISLDKSSGTKCPRCWHYFYEENVKKQVICNRCSLNTLGEGEKRKFF